MKKLSVTIAAFLLSASLSVNGQEPVKKEQKDGDNKERKEHKEKKKRRKASIKIEPCLKRQGFLLTAISKNFINLNRETGLQRIRYGAAIANITRALWTK